MTDKNNMDELLQANPLSNEDEQLLQSFFANCQTEIPDDGFSDMVMDALPVLESEKAAAKRRRMEHVWTCICMTIGVFIAVVCQGWEQIQGFLFSMKIDFLMSGSRVLTQVVDSICQSHNLWMTIAGCFVIACVWGYNEALDAKE